MKKLFILTVAALGMLACDSNTPDNIAGALPGLFSVSARKKVQFSQGNLQYQASTGTWRFAQNQWDIIGEANKYISDAYYGWIDLFGWGTGTNPTLSSNDAISDYSFFSEWGTNEISNGDNKTNRLQWRTLTNDEWKYLFRSRPNAVKLFGFGSVNGVNGIIILPDKWTTPSGLVFYAGTEKGLYWAGMYEYDDEEDHYKDNVYTSSEWAMMQTAGAVFLPAAGRRYSSSVGKASTAGYYWSATPYSQEERAYCIVFDLVLVADARTPEQKYVLFLGPSEDLSRSCGLSVRLVH